MASSGDSLTKSKGDKVGLELCFKTIHRVGLSRVEWEIIPSRRAVEAKCWLAPEDLRVYLDRQSER